MKTARIAIESLGNYIDNNKIECVIFDIDGTLVDSQSLHRKAYKQVFEERGLRFDIEIWNQQSISGGSKWLEKMLEKNGVEKERWDAIVASVKSDKYIWFRKNVSKLKAIRPVVKLLLGLHRKRKYKLVCVTTAGREGAGMMLRSIRVTGYFDFVITSEDVDKGKTKPHPSAYKLASLKTGVDPDKCLAIEDSDTGVTAAISAKIPCYNISTNMLNVPNLNKQKMRGVILVGGSGKRLSPLTDQVQKVILPVWKKPLIYYSIETLVRCGIKDIAIVLGNKSCGEIMRLLQGGEKFGCKFTYLFQEGGVAKAISSVENFVRGESFCVLMGDNIILDDISIWTGNHRGGGLVTHRLIEDTRDLTSLEIEGRKVARVIDSRVNSGDVGKWTKQAYAGVLILDNTAFDKIRSLSVSPRGEVEIVDLLNLYAQEGNLMTDVLGGIWVDAGRFEDLLNAGNIIRDLEKG